MEGYTQEQIEKALSFIKHQLDRGFIELSTIPDDTEIRLIEAAVKLYEQTYLKEKELVNHE